MTFLLNKALDFFGRLWPYQSVKRRRDSTAENEEDDLFVGCETLSKRPKWMTTDYHSNSIMSSGEGVQHTPMKNPVTNDIHDPSPIECRPPLSTLVVKPKNKTVPAKAAGSQKHHVHNEKRQNGVHHSVSNSFTSSLRPSKSFTYPKHTTLNETFKIEEKMKYSKLLEDYFTNSKVMTPKFNHNPLQQARTNFPLVSVLQTPPVPSHKPVAFIDLTGEKKRGTRLPVKPWQAGNSSTDDDVAILEDRRQVPRINTLERKLSEHNLVSPDWIAELREKFSERERDTMRQVEEVKLKRELYARHNQRKRMEALDERIRKHLQITDVVLDDTEEVSALPEITPQMKEKIDRALKPTPSSEVLVEGFGQRITRHDVQTLNKLNWLNDEVINFYMNLLIERGKEEKNTSIYAFNTFFYPKLISQGYSSLKRWTKKVDIFSQELLLVPIHLGMHWCMATIDFRNRTVSYYDSMGGDNNRCLNALLKYLNEESLDKKKKPYDTSDWKLENVKNIPQQMNGSDCGMFSCMFAEYVSRNSKITFSQKDMPYFRQKMVYEIISKSLLQ